MTDINNLSTLDNGQKTTERDTERERESETEKVSDERHASQSNPYTP